MTLLLGVLIGASIGFAACSLCVISKQADEKAKACNSHEKLLSTISNALSTLTIMKMPEGAGVATNAELVDILIDSFQTTIAEAEKG